MADAKGFAIRHRLSASRWRVGTLPIVILALVLSQALISLHGHRQAMVAWFLGIVAFVVTLALILHPLFFRVEMGSIAGAGISALAMGLFFLRRLSRGVEAGSLASLVEQIEYGTLEI